MHTVRRLIDNPAGIVLCTAVGYVVLAILAQKIIYNHATACAFWPAAGVAVFAVLKRGKWGLAGTMIGTVVECVVIFSEKLPANGWELFALTSVTALGNCIEVLLLASLVYSMFNKGTDIMENFSKQIGFLAAALICSIPSAICGVLMGCFTGVSVWSRCIGDIALWTVGDTFGIFTIVPLLLVTVTNRSKSSLEDAAEWTWGISFVLVVSILAGVGFWSWPISNVVGDELWTLPAATYLLLVVVVLGCFYLKQSWILLGVSLVSAIAVAATVRKMGPLSVTEQSWKDGQMNRVLKELPTAINLYSFLFTLGLVGLCVSTAAARRLRRAKADKLSREAVELAEDELLDVSPIGIGWSVFNSEHGEFLKVSKKLAEEFGYRDACEMQGDINGAKSIYVHPEDRHTLKAFLNENPGKAFDDSIEMKKKDGQHLYIHLFASKVKRNGQTTILGFAKDVTSGMRRRSFHQIVQAVANTLRVTDPTKPWISECLVKANLGFGLDAKISLAKEVRIWLALDPLNDRDSVGDFRLYGPVVSIDKTTKRHTAAEIIETELKNPNSYLSVIWDDKQIAGVIVVDTPHWLFMPDVNEPRESDGSSLTDDVSLTSLRETVGLMIAQAFWKELVEERNKLIFDLAPIGMFYANPNGEVYNYNEKAKELNGIGSEDVTSWNWLDSLTDGCRNRLKREWEDYSTACYDDPENRKPRTFREFHKNRGNGVRLLDVMVLPIVQEGRCVGFMGTLQDNTEIEYEKAEGNFMRQVFTHDARSSLLMMSGALAELNPDYFPFNEHQKKLISRIVYYKQELEWLAGINKNFCEFNPTETLRSIVGGHDTLGKACEVIGDNSRVVSGRQDVFQRVAKNLVTNAIKNQVQGGKVEVSVEFMQKHLSLRVSNRTDLTVIETSKSVEAANSSHVANQRDQWGQDKLREHENFSDLELLVELNYRENERGLILCRFATRGAGGDLKFKTKDDLVIATLTLPVENASLLSGWSESLAVSEVSPILDLLEQIVLKHEYSQQSFDELKYLFRDKRPVISNLFYNCREESDRLKLCEQLLREHNNA